MIHYIWPAKDWMVQDGKSEIHVKSISSHRPIEIAFWACVHGWRPVQSRLIGIILFGVAWCHLSHQTVDHGQVRKAKQWDHQNAKNCPLLLTLSTLWKAANPMKVCLASWQGLCHESCDGQFPWQQIPNLGPRGLTPSGVPGKASAQRTPRWHDQWMPGCSDRASSSSS